MLVAASEKVDGIYEAKLGLTGVAAMTSGGTTTLAGELKLSLNTFSPSFDQNVLLISNTSANALVTTFSGLANGAEVFAEYNDSGQGYSFNIRYDWDTATNTAGAGNDVMLVFNAAIPEPSAAGLLIPGMALLLFRRRSMRRVV